MNKITYEVKPKGCLNVIRKCPKCGKKTAFISTHNFRVNANGKKIDVWLIFQCKVCRHSYNLTIFERQYIRNLDPGLYDKFLANDKVLALECAMDYDLFRRNKAQVMKEDLEYEIIPIQNSSWKDDCKIIHIKNPYGLKLRVDKALSAILEISRSDLKKQFLKHDFFCDRRFIGKELEVNVGSLER